jgi:hypothetical protein
MSSWIYLLVCVLTILDYLVPLPALGVAAAVLVVVFIAREFMAAPPTQRIIGAGLTVAGVAAGWSDGDAMGVLVDGIHRGQVFLVLFAAVAWLQVPVGRSPALRAAREMVFRQSANRRYLWLAGAVHGLGGVLNLAGVSLLSAIIVRQRDAATRRQLSRSLMQGFTSASCWSPFFVSMTVIITVMPTVRWLDVAVPGVSAGVLLVALSWLTDRLISGKGVAAAEAAKPVVMPSAVKVRLVGIVLSLILSVVLLVELSGLPIPIVLGLVGPPYALAWSFSLYGRLLPPATVAAAVTGRVMAHLPDLRSEAIVFVTANIFGAGIARAISPDAVSRLLDAISLSTDFKLFLLTVCFVVCGAIGVHPVVVVMVVGHVLPPEVLGVSIPVMAFLMLAMWGIGTLVSPFSATTLFVSRIVGVSIWSIAWRWNVPYVLAASTLTFLLAVAIRHANVY